jgi:hypothetical protein
MLRWIALAGASLLFAACSGGPGSITSAPPASGAALGAAAPVLRGAMGSPALHSLMLPPAGTIYLGARVDPSGGPYNQSNVHVFETQIGRTLALDNHYHQWTGKWPGAEEADDSANHRIPVVAWDCGATNYQVAGAGSGGPNAAAINAQIDATAAAVKAFGAPIMIRWFWEMNLTDGDQHRQACWDPAHDLTINGAQYFSPAWYAAAFDYIVARFKADGATNAIWLWCPSGGGQPQAPYYPGDSAVDWLSFDHYAIKPDMSLVQTLSAPYAALTAINPSKPILVAESATLPANQPYWLTGAAAALQTFPNIKGFEYFDATGNRASWALSSGGNGSGMQLFTAFANAPYLSAP